MARFKNPNIKKRNEILADRYRSGESFRSLLQDSGMSESNLRKILVSEGINLSTSGEYLERSSLSEWHRSFGMLVSEVAMDSGISQEDFAIDFGMTVRRLLEIERGERDLTITQFVKICDYLKIDPIEALKGLV